MPQQGVVHALVFMAIDVAGSRKATESISGWRSFTSSGSLRDASETISNARTTAYTVWSAQNAAKSIPAVKLSIAAMLSMMSRRRCAGFLEGMNGVSQNGVTHQRFQRPAVYDVGGAVEHVVYVQLQSRVIENPHRAVLVEFD